jgi:hypothetical protein
MRLKILALCAGAIAILSASNAAAATKCYEETLVEPEMVCSSQGTSKSADFSSGCTYTEAQIVSVEVKCPAMWVNMANTIETHSQTCKRVGLKTSSIEGKKCASGEHQPASGQEWDKINYRYGRFGGRDFGGNLIRQTSDRTVKQYDTITVVKGGLFCYDTDDNRTEGDATDRLVAYACGP